MGICKNNRGNEMSHATQCDLCPRTYQNERGSVLLDLTYMKSKGGECDSWSLDLCVNCAARVLDIVKPALEDFSNFPRTKAKNRGSDGKN